MRRQRIREIADRRSMIRELDEWSGLNAVQMSDADQDDDYDYDLGGMNPGLMADDYDRIAFSLPAVHDIRLRRAIARSPITYPGTLIRMILEDDEPQVIEEAFKNLEEREEQGRLTEMDCRRLHLLFEARRIGVEFGNVEKLDEAAGSMSDDGIISLTSATIIYTD